MMEKKRIEEADSNVRQYVTDGLLKTRDEETKKLVPFFMDQAERSLRTAAVIFELSTDTAARDAMRLEKGFESHLWVIVTSYYSMFYAALALLARQGIRAGRHLVHKVVADALIHFFISGLMLRVAVVTRGRLVLEEHVCEMTASSIQSAAALQRLKRGTSFREGGTAFRALSNPGKS